MFKITFLFMYFYNLIVSTNNLNDSKKLELINKLNILKLKTEEFKIEFQQLITDHKENLEVKDIKKLINIEKKVVNLTKHFIDLFIRNISSINEAKLVEFQAFYGLEIDSILSINRVNNKIMETVQSNVECFCAFINFECDDLFNE